MLNPQRNAASSKRKFEIGITTFTLFLCVLGLAGMSITSFFQTQSAFEPLNDPTMEFQGIKFGMWIAFLCALIFQYGQNAALYVKNTYATGKTVINLFGIWNIKDTTLCWIVFWLCASIDAGTNCLWLYNQPDIRKQHPIFQTIEYSSMIAIVFVEEVLGIVLQALAHSFTLLRQIIASERSIITKKNNESQSSQQQPKSSYQPQHRPNDKQNKNQKTKEVNPFFAPKEQSRKEPSYQNTQQSHKQPEKPSQSRMSNILKAPQDNEYMRKMIAEQQSQKSRGLYGKIDGTEDMPDELFE